MSVEAIIFSSIVTVINVAFLVWDIVVMKRNERKWDEYIKSRSK